MKTKEFLDEVSKQIKYKPANKLITEELEAHIEDIKNDNLCKGYSEKEAEEKAVEQMGDAIQIGRRLNKIHRPQLDWKLVILISILIGFGILNSNLQPGYYLVGTTHIGTKIGILIGALLGIGIYFLDYRKIKKQSNFIYLIATTFVIIPKVYLMLTLAEMNTRLWNIAIPLYIIAFAGYIANYNKNKDFIKILALSITSFILLLIVSESITNAGIMVLAYIGIATAKIVKENKKFAKKLAILYLGTFIITTLLTTIMINIPYLLSFNSELHYQEYGYIMDAKTNEVLQNVKWVGEAETPQITENRILNSNSSQFTFIYLLGKIGVLPCLLLILAIILTSIKLVKSSKDIDEAYGKYLIIGLSTLYMIQSIVNILMNVNIGIRTDVNLPFVSNGTIYVLINILSFAIILSVYRRKNINFEELGDEQTNENKSDFNIIKSLY